MSLHHIKCSYGTGCCNFACSVLMHACLRHHHGICSVHMSLVIDFTCHCRPSCSSAAFSPAALQPGCMACRHSSETWEAVGALSRHVVLKTPDKADFRAVATDASVALVSNLPVISQHQFVLFAARLSRTPKVRLQMCSRVKQIKCHANTWLASCAYQQTQQTQFAFIIKT